MDSKKNINILLNENERIDDLEFKDLRIIQNTKGFCFGIDSILLSDFAKNIKKGASVIDLGTGTGILNILLSAKTEANHFVGIEIQKDVADMAKRSIVLNNLENKISIINDNILNLKNSYKNNTFDVVVTNPPYKKLHTGLINKEDKKIISRHEVTATLEDFINISSYLLKDFGELYIIHRPERLVDIFYLMRNSNIEPKKIKFVYPNKNKKSNLVLIKGVKLGNPFLEFDNNLYVYDQNGNYTNDILKIYNKL